MSSCNDLHCGETAVRFDAFGAWCMRHRWKAPIESMPKVPDWAIRQASRKEIHGSNGGDYWMDWVADGNLYRATLIALVKDGLFTAADLDWSDAHVCLVRRATDCKRCGGYGYIVDPDNDPPSWPMREEHEPCACLSKTAATEYGGSAPTPLSIGELAQLLEGMPPASEIPRSIEVCPSDWAALEQIAVTKNESFETLIPNARGLPICRSYKLRPGQLKVTYADGHSEIKEMTR